MDSRSKGLERFGFTSNPFRLNLAEIEPDLPAYYRKPPYFDAIFGDAENQTSRIITGDFGRGKTALRKRIEFETRRLNDHRVLCVSYDDFPYLTTGGDLTKISLAVHIDEIMKRLTLALLMLVHLHGTVKLNQVQRSLARWFVKYYHDSLTSTEKEAYSKSVSTVPEHYWKKFRENSGTIINWISTGLSVLSGVSVSLDSPNFQQELNAFGGNPLLLLQKMYDVICAFGVKSVIIVIDGVDQSGAEMQDEAKIVAFLRPLLFHYNLLSLRESSQNRQVYGFKIFLPFADRINRVLKDGGFRFDRVLQNRIEWNWDEMNQIWLHRLAHYSERRVLELRSICEDSSVDERIISCAQGVPRLMLIQGAYIVEEVDRTDFAGNKIPKSCTDAAYNRFVREYGEPPKAIGTSA